MFRCNSKRVWGRSNLQKLNGKSRSKNNIYKTSLCRTKGNLHQVTIPIWSYIYGIKTLLRELASVYGKDIDYNYVIDWEV